MLLYRNMSSILIFIENILSRKVSFVTVFVLVFGASFAFLYAVDFYPEAPEDISTETTHPNHIQDDGMSEPQQNRPSILHLEANLADENDEPTPPAPINTSNDQINVGFGELPQSITFNSLNKTVGVLNPSSRTISDLDAALLNGAVRHPDSATFANEGTIFILGHSSYLPVVNNKNYQAFNDIQNLKWGETIELTSEDTVYTYRVDKVYQAKASEVTVPIAGTGPKLVIATCNSFASKDDRFVVESSLTSSKPL